MGAKFGHKISEETREKIKRTMLDLISKGKISRTNGGSFKKGRTPWNKGKVCPQFRRENAANWKGGIETYREMAIEMGKDLSRCQICKDTKRKIVIHHIDGNRNNNIYRNLGVVCTYCHNAIHDNPGRKQTRFQIGHLPYTNKLPT